MTWLIIFAIYMYVSAAISIWVVSAESGRPLKRPVWLHATLLFVIGPLITPPLFVIGCLVAGGDRLRKA